MSPLNGHQVWHLIFGTVDGRLMLASGGMESPRIWDTETSKCLFIEIDQTVTALAFGDSGTLIVGTRRGSISLELSSAWANA